MAELDHINVDGTLYEFRDAKAYQKPNSGIPPTDLTSAIQELLQNASTALQPSDLSTLNSDVAALKALVETDSDNVIDKFNEIVAFLNGISASSSLDGIISNISSQISAKYAKPASGIPMSDLSSEVQQAINSGGSSPTITMDDTPTSGSSNPVKSSGIYNALQGKQNTLTFDSTPTASSTNPVTSGGVKKETSTIKSSLTQVLNCIQDLDGNELNIVDGQGNIVFKITKDGAQSIKFIDKEGNDILDGVQAIVNELGKCFQDLRGDLLYVTDNEGNIIFKINAAGAESVDFQANKRKLSEAPLGWYGNTLYVTDNDGNFVFYIDSNGIHCTKIFANSFSIPGLHNDWYDKIIATYGDSVTATNNGDFQRPFSNLDANWGNRVASYFSMYRHYGRGIGGQGYSWGVGVGDAGGSVCWLTPSGVLINRLDGFNYDNWDGETYPSGVTAEMEQQGTAIRVRGCLSSWLRITKMFPASIKDSIDVILVMAHNDTYDETPCSFIANDTTDPEWAASGNDYYGLINGDYNINTFRGGVASTLMKLQLWMPNAVIVLMTGISGQGNTGEIATRISYPDPRNKAEGIREMSKLTSIPCIDAFANDGINGWNRTYYIADNIHPNYTYGRNMLSRAIIGGLKTILPKEQIV